MSKWLTCGYYTTTGGFCQEELRKFFKKTFQKTLVIRLEKCYNYIVNKKEKEKIKVKQKNKKIVDFFFWIWYNYYRKEKEIH